MEPQDPYAIIAQLMQLQPEWSISKQKFQPMDGDFQQDQVRYRDNLLSTIMDPAYFAASPDGFNMGALESTFEEEVTPGDKSGAAKLEKIANSPTPSIEQAIAVGLLDGMSSSQVIDQLVASGKIVTPPKLDERGQPLKTGEVDTSELDRYRAWADSSWDSYLSDTEDQVTRTEVPSELATKLQGAGFSDPRQQYTTDNLAAREGVDMEALRQFVGATEQDAQAKIQSLATLQRGTANPSAQAPMLANPPAGPTPMMESLMAGGLSFSDHLMQNGALTLPGGTPSRRAQPGIKEGPSGLARMGTPLSSGPKRSGAAQAQSRKDNTERFKRLNKEIMRSTGERNEARAAEGQQRARSGAIARFLQEQGRTPFIDEYTARLRGAAG